MSEGPMVDPDAIDAWGEAKPDYVRIERGVAERWLAGAFTDDIVAATRLMAACVKGELQRLNALSPEPGAGEEPYAHHSWHGLECRKCCVKKYEIAAAFECSAARPEGAPVRRIDQRRPAPAPAPAPPEDDEEPEPEPDDAAVVREAIERFGDTGRQAGKTLRAKALAAHARLVADFKGQQNAAKYWHRHYTAADNERAELRHLRDHWYSKFLATVAERDRLRVDLGRAVDGCAIAIRLRKQLHAAEAAREKAEKERDWAQSALEQMESPQISCKAEREAGNGGCGCCAICVDEQRQAREKAEAEARQAELRILNARKALDA